MEQSYTKIRLRRGEWIFWNTVLELNASTRLRVDQRVVDKLPDHAAPEVDHVLRAEGEAGAAAGELGELQQKHSAIVEVVLLRDVCREGKLQLREWAALDSLVVKGEEVPRSEEPHV